MTHFVLTYDRSTQNSVIDEFDDALRAFAAFSQRERELIADARYEVVMLSAKTQEELRISHPNFFAHGDLLPVVSA